MHKRAHRWATVAAAVLVGSATFSAREAVADDFGFSVLKCFHPTADYAGSTLGDEYMDGDGRTTRNGHITFKGGFSGASYSMDFVLHARTDKGDKFLRVTPTKDDAPFPPAPKCYMREWWRSN